MMGRYDFWEQLDLPGEVPPGQVLVEIAGDDHVLVEHHQGVLEYCPECISIRVRYGMLQVCGNGLMLRYMTKEQLVISGRIDRVILKRRTDK